MEVELHPKQFDIFEDDHRFKVAVCGRRFGKTTLAVVMAIYKAMQKESQVWYIAPSYRMAKQIAWEMLNKIIPREVITKSLDNELTIYLRNGSKIALKGADSPDSLRGVGLDFVIIDEYADIKSNVWEEIIRPTLLDKGGSALFIGTPKGFNHFYDVFNKERDDNNWKSWQFKSSDNPFIPKDELLEAKKTTTEDYFAQEYEADFRKYTGLIYKEFSRDIHAIEPRELPNGSYLYRGMDFGDQNPTAVQFVVMTNNGEWYLVDELHIQQTAISEMAGIIKAKTDYWVGKGYSLAQTWGDPSGASMIREYGSFSIHISPAIKDVGTGADWVQSGIEKVRELLKVDVATHRPKLFVFNTCVHTIEEFEKYRWRENKSQDDVNYPSIPEKAYDHHLDAIRYIAVSSFQTEGQEPVIVGYQDGLGGVRIPVYR